MSGSRWTSVSWTCIHQKITICFLVFNVLLNMMMTPCQGEITLIPLKRANINGALLSQVRNYRARRSLETMMDNLKGKPGEGYYMEVQIGTPPQKLNILIDTGSSNFAIAAAPNKDVKTFFHSERSSTYHEDGTVVYVPYTQGNWRGILGTDVTTLTSMPNITVKPNIAFITSSQNFFINTSNWQGIVGFAYQEIARPDSTLQPYFDTLVKNGHVSDIFSMQLCGTPLSSNGSEVMMDGTMVIGGISSQLYKGKIFYTPIHKEWYYEVIISDVEVDGISLGMDCKEYNYDKTIVDSGTTNLRFPTKVFLAIVSRIQNNLSLTEKLPSSAFWTGNEIVCWTDFLIPYTGFPRLAVSLAITHNSSFKLNLSPAQYLRPVFDPDDPGLVGYCFKFGLADSNSGTVLGAVLMEGFYVIFDRANKRIGFAESACPPRSTAISMSLINGIFFSSASNITKCAYQKPVKDNQTLLVVAYVMAGICAVCVLPLLIMFVQYQVRRCRGPKGEDHTSDSGNLIQDN